MPQHTVTVTAPADPADLHTARCSCGWRAAALDRATVQRAAAFHPARTRY